MIFNPLTKSGQTPSPGPQYEPNPEKVREIVEGFTSHNIGSRDTYGTIAGILFYLGNPFACIGIFESIDEMGMSEEGKAMYKECFLGVLEILNIEVEWESEYRLKQQEEAVFANIDGNYDALWTKQTRTEIAFSYLEKQLNDYIDFVNDSTLDYIQRLGEEMARIIDDEALY